MVLQEHWLWMTALAVDCLWFSLTRLPETSVIGKRSSTTFVPSVEQ